MDVVDIVALILFALGGILPFLPNVDVRAAFVCVAIGGIILSLDAGGAFN